MKADKTFRVLGISLGKRCNFRCDHCFPRSAPESLLDISEKEIDFIVSLIKKHRFEEISFTGGEPLIFYRKQMELILSEISDLNIKTMVTTNASIINCCKNWKDIISKLPISKYRISFDKFHNKFIDKKAVIEFIRYLKQIGKETSIEFCIQGPFDLNLYHSLPTDIKTNVSIVKTSNSGRARDTNVGYKYFKFEKAHLHGQCPMIKNGKVLYFPGRGLSYCCSNLIFDKNIDEKELFFSSIEELEKNKYFRIISNLEFDKIDLEKFKSDPINSQKCNLCANYLKNLFPTKVSL